MRTAVPPALTAGQERIARAAAANPSGGSTSIWTSWIPLAPMPLANGDERDAGGEPAEPIARPHPAANAAKSSRRARR